MCCCTKSCEDRKNRKTESEVFGLAHNVYTILYANWTSCGCTLSTALSLRYSRDVFKSDRIEWKHVRG